MNSKTIQTEKNKSKVRNEVIQVMHEKALTIGGLLGAREAHSSTTDMFFERGF